MNGGVVLVERADGKALWLCELSRVDGDISRPRDIGLLGMSSAAQIPFTVATAVPKDFCSAQAPVFSFQATPTHSLFCAHKSTQVVKVAPVTTGCLSSTHSLRVIMLHETWN
jgi:hypothetical protein